MKLSTFAIAATLYVCGERKLVTSMLVAVNAVIPVMMKGKGEREPHT
ncbi:hypothetical protein [Nostoc commune]|nr:hypothetical protein [Nostoc commune]